MLYRYDRQVFANHPVLDCFFHARSSARNCGFSADHARVAALHKAQILARDTYGKKPHFLPPIWKR